MLDITNFNAVWHFQPKYHYSAHDQQSIHHHRRELGGHLFLDRLLSSLSITSSEQLYPPKTNDDLRKLHKSIADADVAEHWRVSALYYLLRDCQQEGRGDGLQDFKHAEDFARKTYLPEKYRVCVEGLWHLDQLNLKQSLDSLTLPSLLPAFPEAVLRTLLHHAPSRPENLILPFAYYESVSPPLTSSPDLLNAYFRYLCTLSLTSALTFLRAQPVHLHRAFLETLVESALAGGEPGAKRAERGVELVGLPLSSEEEGWFEEFLLRGAGKGLHGARDTVMLRRIAGGKVGEAEELGKGLKGRKVDDVSWEEVKYGLAAGVGDRAKGFGEVFRVEKC